MVHNSIPISESSDEGAGLSVATDSAELSAKIKKLEKELAECRKNKPKDDDCEEKLARARNELVAVEAKIKESQDALNDHLQDQGLMGANKCSPENSAAKKKIQELEEQVAKLTNQRKSKKKAALEMENEKLQGRARKTKEAVKVCMG